jgi:hypothetical protein
MILSRRNFRDVDALPTTELMLNGMASPAGAHALDGARQKTSPESTSDCAVSIIAGFESNQPYPRTTVRFEASPSSRRVNIARCGKKLVSCSAFVTRNTIYAEQERHFTRGISCLSDIRVATF